MSYVDKAIPEKDILPGIVKEMTSNGWRVIHHFIKLGVRPSFLDTAMVKFTTIGPPIDWILPVGLSPTNFRVFHDMNGQGFHELGRGTDFNYDSTTNTVRILGMGSPEMPCTAYIYYPRSKPDDNFAAHIGEHYILENNQKTAGKRRTLFGLARYADMSFPYMYVSDLRPFLSPGTSDFTKFVINDEGKFLPKVLEMYKSNSGFSRPAIYSYMLDKYENPDAVGVLQQESLYTVTIDEDPKRVVMDAEVFENGWTSNVMGGLPTSRVTKMYPQHLQSPLVECDFRHPELSKLAYNPNFGEIINTGNYWPDSNVLLKGQVDEGTASFVIRSDTSPSFELNAVPIIPIFLGEADNLKGYEKKDGDISQMDIVFGGTVPKVATAKAVPGFDFDVVDRTKFYIPLTPLMRPFEPSMGNGLDNIIVRRAKNGARYSAHYVSTAVAPQLMPPDRIHDETGMKYPRAWQQSSNSEYNYKFNPSRATGDITAGEMYLMHPEDGMRGTIRHTILSNPLSIFNEDTLRVTDDWCPPGEEKGYQDFTYFLVDGISPVTKKPSIHYRPMGLAILGSSANLTKEKYSTETVVGPVTDPGGMTAHKGKVHFSGIFLGGKDDINFEQAMLYQEDPVYGYGNIITPGDYPDTSVAVPRAHQHTVDSIAIPEGLTIEIYELPNYQGSLLYRFTGPLLVHTALRDIYKDNGVYFGDHLEDTAWQNVFPLASQYWVPTYPFRDMGSFKIKNT